MVQCFAGSTDHVDSVEFPRNGMNVQLVVASGSRTGQVIPIMGERFVVGRADDCHLKPRSELISRYHCEIFLEDGGVFVRDMGSKNGVFLNNEKITDTRELKNGDKVAFGPLEFFMNIITEPKPTKPPKVKSVSDAVARTVALRSEGSEQSTEDAITDWLLVAGEGHDETETRTIDSTDLMAHLHAQSEEAARHEKEEEDSAMSSGSGIKPGISASSKAAAAEALQKFFKGGK